MATLPPEPIIEDRSDKVRHASNQKYARDKAKVLADLAGNNPDAPKATFVPQTLATDGQISGQIAVR